MRTIPSYLQEMTALKEYPLNTTADNGHLNGTARSNGKAAIDADLRLLRRFANQRDADAFAQIVQKYSGVVYATALRILGDGARAEDVSQETFFRLMRRPHDIKQNVGAWLHRTATHLALDCLRSESSRRKREIAYEGDCEREASTWAELSPAIDQALTELPEELQLLLVRHYLLGQTQAELAEQTGHSPATISRRMKAALEELRLRLRLKGLTALPAVLAGLLCHVAARKAPATLAVQLGKMSLIAAMGPGEKMVASANAKVSRVSRFAGSASANFPLIMAVIAMCVMTFLLQRATMHFRSPSPSNDPIHEIQQR
jgi:RNA polymerase sigma-70 factor (ECF subfamily)